MNDSILRKRKIFVKCPRCDGHKGIFGHSALGHPATLPCDRCDATGEVDQDTIEPIDPEQAFYDTTKKWGW
jgi:hypothetical protein